MAKEYAKSFYNSRAWRNSSKAYAKSVGCLCERCKKNGIIKPYKIVHHKIYISPENIHDISITLNWDNFEAVCKECHDDEHLGDYKPTVKGTRFDEYGNIVSDIGDKRE